MTRYIENILHLANDMQAFSPAEDALTKLIERHTDEELSEFELDFVAAATSAPSFADFLKRATEKK